MIGVGGYKLRKEIQVLKQHCNDVRIPKSMCQMKVLEQLR